MKETKNDLLMFVGGLAMLVVGLFIFSQKVIVRATFFGAGWTIGGFRVNSGLVVIPFIIGIVWMFATSSFASKVFTGFSIMIIIAAIIMNTDFYLSRVTLYEWALMLVLIFGGLGLTARVLLAGDNSKKESKKESKRNDNIDNIDSQLEAMKKNMK